jgi:hypothetical protein
MKKTETVKLIRAIKALCPSQPFDEYTPDAWALVMIDITFAEAESAVRTIYREQGSDAQWIRAIEADDIIRQVKRDRSGRDKVVCCICSRTRAECQRMRDFEIRHGIPEPHEFESADGAERNASRRQLLTAIPRLAHPNRTPWLPDDLLPTERNQPT